MCKNQQYVSHKKYFVPSWGTNVCCQKDLCGNVTVEILRFAPPPFGPKWLPQHAPMGMPQCNMQSIAVAPCGHDPSPAHRPLGWALLGVLCQQCTFFVFLAWPKHCGFLGGCGYDCDNIWWFGQRSGKTKKNITLACVMDGCFVAPGARGATHGWLLCGGRGPPGARGCMGVHGPHCPQAPLQVKPQNTNPNGLTRHTVSLGHHPTTS